MQCVNAERRESTRPRPAGAGRRRSDVGEAEEARLGPGWVAAGSATPNPGPPATDTSEIALTHLALQAETRH